MSEQQRTPDTAGAVREAGDLTGYPGGLDQLLGDLGSSHAKLRAAATEHTVRFLASECLGYDPRASKVKVADALREFPDSLGEHLDDLSNQVLETLGANRHAPAWLLRRLAEKPELVRTAVAANQATPADVLAALAHDSFRPVRYGVAGNPSTPPDTLIAMADPVSYDIVEALAGNPSAPASVREKLNALIPGTGWPCLVCGGPGGAVVVVESPFLPPPERDVPAEMFIERFPAPIASWCPAHAQAWSITIETRESPQRQSGLRPDRAPAPDELEEGLELFYRRAPYFEGWGWSHGPRSLRWWLAGRQEIRCGERGPYLDGNWPCDRAAVSVVGDRRWGGDYAVCASHEEQSRREWAGYHATWDPDQRCWVWAGAPIVRPKPWVRPLHEAGGPAGGGTR